MQSKYYEKFSKLSASQLPLRGNRLLVEVFPKEEIKSKGGLIISSDRTSHRTTTEQNRGTLAIVLAAGPGYVNERNDEDVPLEMQVGAIILVSDYGLKYFSQFPGLNEYTQESIAITRDTEIHAFWPSLEAYLAYAAAVSAS